MATPFRLGMIGGSVQSAVGQVHRIAATMDRKFTVVAGCFSRNPKVNRATAESYQIPKEGIFDNIENLLQRAMTLDAVSILTPTPSHYEIVQQCQKHHVAVICEKALASTSSQALRLNDPEQFLAVTYNYSGYPMVRALREMIRMGSFGKLCHLRAEMPQEGYLRLQTPSPQPWRLMDGPIPTLYLDLGVHLHQLVHYLTGYHPLEVFATENQYGRYEVVDSVNAIAQYEHQLEVSMWFGKSALGERNGLRLRVYGTQGAAEWVQEDPEHLLFSDSLGCRKIIDRGGLPIEALIVSASPRFKAGHPAGFIEAFANLYTDIHQALRQYYCDGRWSSKEVYGAGFAAEGLAMMEAMTASAKSHKPRIVEQWHD